MSDLRERAESMIESGESEDVLIHGPDVRAILLELLAALAAEQAKAREFAGIILTHAAALARGDDLSALDLLCERSRGTVVSRRAMLDASDDVAEALKLRCIAMTAAAKDERGIR